MGQVMRTQWHRAVEHARHGHIALRAGSGAVLDELEKVAKVDPRLLLRREALIDLMDDLSDPSIPRYVFDRELIDMMRTREDVARSLRAIHEAGLARLPFPRMTVEWDDVDKDNRPVRRIVVLEERSEAERIRGEERPHPFRARVFDVRRFDHTPAGGQEGIGVSPSVFFIAFAEDAGPEKAFGIDWHACPSGYVEEITAVEHAAWSTAEGEVIVADKALSAAVLLLNTKGIAKEVIEPGDGLRKARERSGKPPIPRHHVIRIGHIYDRKDRAYEATGRRMPVHFRPGHARRVHVGPWVDGKVNPQTKLVYIEPCIVNYMPGGEMPREPAERAVRW